MSTAVLVVAPMPEELALLRAGPSLPSVVLAVTGDGEHRAREAVGAALARTEARALLAIGVAGALSPGLGPGDLIVARRVVREGGGAALVADARLVDAAARASGARPAIALSAAALADSAAEKRRLLELARARGGEGDGGGADEHAPAVVDLESAAYAAAAEEAGIPWLVLRAVSDTAEEALPALLNRALDGGGAVRRGRVLAGLLGEPSALPRLLDLRRRVRACAGVLARAVTALVDGRVLEPPPAPDGPPDALSEPRAAGPRRGASRGRPA